MTTAYGITIGKVRVVGVKTEAAEAETIVDYEEVILLDVIASQVCPVMARTLQGSIRILQENRGGVR